MSGFDRKKLLIGVYCLKDYAWSEKHVQDLAHAGINYLCAAPADPALLDRCQKYGIGVMATGVLPGWWGGDGEKAGLFAETAPIERYEAAAKSFQPHPAIWGLDTGDEPSALDFPHYGKVFDAMKPLFPAQFPYLNLYPNYAVAAANSSGQRLSQLGAATYEEYIDRYVECVDCDYICYDYYMYTASVGGAFENLRVVADKCRATGRDLWIVLQVNSYFPEKWISVPQLRHQAYTSMAFGSRAICWACWTAGWWDNQVLDEQGEKTQQYDKMCTINRELHAMGERYMKYRNVSSHFLGFEGSEDMKRVKQSAEASVDAGAFSGVTPDSGFSAIVGHMTDDNGAEALLIADATDAQGVSGQAYFIRFRTDRTPTAWMNGLPTPVLQVSDSEYMVRMEPCAGLLIEA